MVHMWLTHAKSPGILISANKQIIRRNNSYKQSDKRIRDKSQFASGHRRDKCVSKFVLSRISCSGLSFFPPVLRIMINFLVSNPEFTTNRKTVCCDKIE